VQAVAASTAGLGEDGIKHLHNEALLGLALDALDLL
jgi:hypothetical protein